MTDLGVGAKEEAKRVREKCSLKIYTMLSIMRKRRINLKEKTV